VTSQLAVVLVEPAGPLNVGSVARLCANFATGPLRLVAPRCDPADPMALMMAVHAADRLADFETYPSLEAAVGDCRRVVACSGRQDALNRPHLAPAPALSWLLEPVAGPERVALVFGREDHGLHNAELDLAGRLLRIPSDAGYSSLNLSHAVAICLAAMAPQPAATPSDPAAPPSSPRPAQAELEATLGDAESLLLEVGFLYPHTARARMAKLRQMLLRAEPSGEELAVLRGMVRQLRWASRHGIAQQSG
jgi:tRNA/rRNA methyltransferase